MEWRRKAYHTLRLLVELPKKRGRRSHFAIVVSTLKFVADAWWWIERSDSSILQWSNDSFLHWNWQVSNLRKKTPSNGLQNINFDDITNLCGFPALASNEFCQLFYFQSANHRTDRPNVFRANTPTSLLKSIVFPSCRHSILTTYGPILSDCLSQRRNWIPLWDRRKWQQIIRK